MTSSFRDGKKYETLMLIFTTGMSYRLDNIPMTNSTTLPNMEIKNLRFFTGSTPFPLANLLLVPYHL